MNTHVSYSIAKSVIQKGFEVQVRPMYYRTYKIDSGSYMYNTDGVLELCTMPLIGLKKGWIDAPTIAEVVMWLYEKHGIWISVDIDGENFDIFYFLVYRNHEERVKEYIKKFNDENYNTNYKTPAEAYEAAFEYTLKKLI